MARMIPKRVLSAVARCGMHCARKPARRRAAYGEIADFVNSPGIQTRRAGDDGSEFRYGVATCVGVADLRADRDCASRASCPRGLRAMRRVAERLAECDLVSILRESVQDGAVWISMTVASSRIVALRPVAAKRSSIAASRGGRRTKQASRGNGRRRHRRRTRCMRDASGWQVCNIVRQRAAHDDASQRHGIRSTPSPRQKKTPAQGRGRVSRTALYQSIAIRARSSDAATRWRTRWNRRAR